MNDTAEREFTVVIVGGGSAGWMTAAYLSKCFREKVRIRLVESAAVPTVGVGEATFSTIRVFLDYLDLKEEEWMPECNASYKLAIRFVDWNAEKRHFYHPFQRFEVVDGRSVCEWWLKLQRRCDTRFDYACYTVPAICDARRAPRFMDGRSFDKTVDAYLAPGNANKAVLLNGLQVQYPYAYHFDAGLFAKFLAKYAQARGVERIVDDVCKVVQDERGNISSIATQKLETISGDLFIDCTGFRGLLINNVLREPFISFQESLPCDSALAMQMPYAPDAEMNPYTTATALSSGWVWDIPLYNRVGTGYVYSSAFLSRGDAEEEFRKFLGERAHNVDCKHIKMRVGRNRRSWVNNCVSIGLASGFVEPLESTGIFFIQHSIEQLATHFPGRASVDKLRDSFNSAVADCIDGVREFLTLHYVASSRADTPFWGATKYELVVPPDLEERLKLWQACLPTNRTINQRYHGFESYSYAVMLLGLSSMPQTNLPLLDYLEDTKAVATFNAIRCRSQQLVETLPSLREYLATQHGAEECEVGILSA